MAEGAEGITLPDHVPRNVAKALKRLHQNLGHPSNPDLARHIRLAGGQEQAVKAALQIKCQTCSRHTKPQISRPGRLVRSLDFGQEVGMDIFNLYAVEKEKLVVMSILDLASGYHVVRKIHGKKSDNYAKLFLEAWASWAGKPNRLVVDQERGFMKVFTDEMEKNGINSHYIAGQAHWQNGMVERQNGWFRSIWEKVVEDKSVYALEAEWALMEVCHAKNTLRRVHGYSPSQWVFGGEPRTGDPALDGDEDDLQPPTTTPTTEWVRRQEIRVEARRAFLTTQGEDTMKRALQGRPRVQHGDFQAGDWVYLFRKTKVPGGAARARQDAGEWIGPGIIVGQEGGNFWVSRGGRCLLCAREHLRQAESEELGSLFQTRTMKEDLLRLIQNLDRDDGDEDLYLDATAAEAPGAKGTLRRRDYDDAPARRLRAKQPLRDRKRKLPQGDEGRPEGEGSADEDEVRGASSTLMAERGMTKAQQVKLDKEIKWEEIPSEERPLYLKAEKKQWADHTRCNAVRVLTEQETLHVRETFPKERILRSRFAYRDKNCAKRREDPSIPPKPKARLCVGGHRDPDLKTGELRTEAPTASKAALSALMVLTAVNHWDVAAGDIECAFLQGMENQRNLYMEQPVRGLPGVPKGALIQMLKGVFGLCDSPRLWWEKLSRDLLKMKISVDGMRLHFKQHPLDACFFLLYDENETLHGALTTHVDDLLLSSPKAMQGGATAVLVGAVPDQRVGGQVLRLRGAPAHPGRNYRGDLISQRSYVNTRLETVDFDKAADAEELAGYLVRKDNESVAGALSWLAAQSRPDLQVGVSMAQRKQRAPLLGDVRDTNRVVRQAQKGKDYGPTYPRLQETWDDLVLVVFHDAAWANVPATDSCPELDEGEASANMGIYSQLGHLVGLTSRRVLRGERAPGLLCTWKSHACPRVCRSTFAAETMSAFEDALAFRSLLAGAINPSDIGEARARSWP